MNYQHEKKLVIQLLAVHFRVQIKIADKAKYMLIKLLEKAKILPIQTQFAAKQLLFHIYLKSNQFKIEQIHTDTHTYITSSAFNFHKDVEICINVEVPAGQTTVTHIK